MVVVIFQLLFIVTDKATEEKVASTGTEKGRACVFVSLVHADRSPVLQHFTPF